MLNIRKKFLFPVVLIFLVLLWYTFRIDPYGVQESGTLSPHSRFDGLKISRFSPKFTNVKDFSNYASGQHGDDIFLYNNYFFGIANGTVLESGALDGKRFSNSRAFEMYMGWKSILVEASPFNYALLQRNRPQSVCINAALCSQSRLLHFVTTNSRNACGLIVEFANDTSLQSGLPEVWAYREANNGHFNSTQFNQLGVKQPNNISMVMSDVHCLRMSDLVTRLHVTYIDLWILVRY